MKIAINGFGRIGRTAARIIFSAHSDVELVAINDLTDTKTLAHLLQHDTQYRKFAKKVTFDDDHLIVDGHKIKSLAEKEPAKLPWGELGIDVLVKVALNENFVNPEDTVKTTLDSIKNLPVTIPTGGSILLGNVLSTNVSPLFYTLFE
jgi:glyceraldehyde 3-phosphate dehydrogenase